MRSTWLNRRAIGLHITAAVLIPTFLLLGNWQLHRALGGNTLSWAYTFEWPIFAVYGVYMWWKLVHDIADDSLNASSATNAVVDAEHAVADAAEDPELAAYNAYLASLHAPPSPTNQGRPSA